LTSKGLFFYDKFYFVNAYFNLGSYTMDYLIMIFIFVDKKDAP